MEPGHEDREYRCMLADIVGMTPPQWSPVMKTGNTGTMSGVLGRHSYASMEPGHEDREYGQLHRSPIFAEDQASMEPGHEDREYFAMGNAITMEDTPQWSPVMKTGNTSCG